MRRALATLLFLASAAFTFAGLVQCGAAGWDKHVRINFDARANSLRGLIQLGEPRAGLERVFVLCDSTGVAYRHGNRFSDELAEILEGSAAAPGASYRVSYRVATGGFAGLHPFDAYYLVGSMAETRPETVMLCLNLLSFSDLRRTWFVRKELSALVPPAHYAEAATLPLHWQGLTLDELVYRSLVLRLVGPEAVTRIQRDLARAGRAWRQLVASADHWAGRTAPRRAASVLRLTGGGRRGGRHAFEEARIRYGPALRGIDAGHPALRMIEATVARLARAHISVLVFAVPTNVEHLERLGLYDAAGLSRSMDRIAAGVEEAGGHFLDLHALLPDAYFRDADGHYLEREPHHGPRRVAEKLADWLRDPARRER